MHPSEDAQQNMYLQHWIYEERVAEWILGGSASSTSNFNPTNCCPGAVEPCDRRRPGANAHSHRLLITPNAVGSGNAAMYKQRRSASKRKANIQGQQAGRAATCALSTIGSGDFDPDDPKLVSISARHHSGGTKPVGKTGNTAWAFSPLGTVSELL